MEKPKCKVISGTLGESIHIPAMFNHNAKDRLAWKEGVLAGRGYRIKMIPQNSEPPIYVKTRGDMEKVIRDNPRINFRVKDFTSKRY
jgi:hypothetical protein